MKKVKINIALYLIILGVLMACSEESPEGISNQAQVESNLNSGLILPPGSFTVDPDQEGVAVDNSISVGTNSGAPMALQVGTTVNANIPFNAPNGNVTAIGMRFGTNGPINFVPINTDNATSGTGSFQFQVTPELCNNLSKICHDVRCYEFAYTSAGRISQSNLTQLALLCGDCDEPSCRGLIDQEVCTIDCSLITDFNSGSGFYFDNFIASQDAFTANPTRTTCNEYYDSLILWYQALIACSDQDTFQGESLIQLIQDVEDLKGELCPAFD